MKKHLLTSLITAGLLLSACDSAETLHTRATQSLEQKNYTQAATEAEALIKKSPDGYDGYFLLAQARTQLGDKNAAITALESAIKKGYKDDGAISANANLQPLHALSAYKQLMDDAFPQRQKAVTAAGDATISDSDSKTVIRAGDVVVELPKDK